MVLKIHTGSCLGHVNNTRIFPASTLNTFKTVCLTDLYFCICLLRPCSCTDKNLMDLFVMYKEIKKGSGAQSYMRKCTNIESFIRKPLFIYNRTWHPPLPNFPILFQQCEIFLKFPRISVLMVEGSASYVLAWLASWGPHRPGMFWCRPQWAPPTGSGWWWTGGWRRWQTLNKNFEL